MPKTLPSSGGVPTPLNDCSGCIEPTAAPHDFSGESTVESNAPLVCNTISPRHSSPPIRASSLATAGIASSGTVSSTTLLVRACTVKPAWGRPAPINRTAFRALSSLRARPRQSSNPAHATAGPMRVPRARLRRSRGSRPFVLGYPEAGLRLQFTCISS
jgi:hypothetical protein